MSQGRECASSSALGPMGDLDSGAWRPRGAGVLPASSPSCHVLARGFAQLQPSCGKSPEHGLFV